MKLRLPPALALLLVAPAFGELFSGSSPLNEYINPVTFITLTMLYGCGAIICRELVVRWGKGWAGLFLLGCAYGIYEEGLLVQSFFDPGWQDLGDLARYGRALGVNWVWAEHLTLFHALISIGASVAFVEALYPARRNARWVNSRFWWISNWVAFIAVLLLWKLLVKYDSGIWQLISLMTILLLATLARVLPTRILPPLGRPASRPRRFFWTAFLGMLVQFLIVYGNVDKTPFIVPMLELVVFDFLILFLILRWNGNGLAWDDRHRMALVNGALSFFLIFGILIVGGQYPIMYFSNPVFLLLLWWAYRKVSSLGLAVAAQAVQAT